MAGASPPELVAAVSNAGALGGLGAAALTPEKLKQQIHQIREKTDKPFNVNLFAPISEQFDKTATPGPQIKALISAMNTELGLEGIPTPGPLFGPAEAQLRVLIEERVPVISFHFGVEAEQVTAIQNAGLQVISSATTVQEAQTLEALGVDAVIAQGTEAGGHRGTFIGDYQNALIGTLALVPQIVDAVSIPVIAAGGIMDARGIVACRALGADAVQLGTAFLGCPESGIPNMWRHAIKTASSDQTTVTTAMSGRPARGLRNRYINEMEALNEQLLPYPLQYSISREIRKRAVETDNPEFAVMWSGQGVNLLQEMPAAELVAHLVNETKALSQRLASEDSLL